MAIIEKIITLTDGSEFKFKYDDTPIETTGNNAYISENAKSNLYCAYKIDMLNKVIPAHESQSKITTSSFNGYLENGFLFDNASLTWNINLDHFVTKSFFANTVFVWYDNSVPYIITEIDTSRLLYNPEVTHSTEYYKLPMSGQSNTCIILSADKTQRLNTINIAPYTIINNSNKLYTFFTFQDVSNTINNTKSNSLESSYSNGFVHNRSTCINSEYTGEIYLALPENAEFVVGKTNGKSQAFTVNDDIDLYIKAGGNPSYKSARACNRLKTEHIVKYCLAGRGLAFLYNDTIIYPIINGGIVTGYTENINDSGDYKEWQGIHDHDVPYEPTGDKDEDELEDSEITLNANGNSFIKWFAVTGQNLLSLIDSFNSETVPAGFVPLDHIVGVYQAPFNIPEFSNCGALTNIFVGKYDTNVQGMPLLNQGSYSTTGIIASKYIEPTHNNFLDYEPYTSLSLYLPFCGSCNLDANLFVGKTVNVDYYFDIFSGDVIANVYANGTLYKTLSGNFTISQPITSQNVGLQKDTVIKGAVGVATNMLGTAGFAMSGNISGALSGAVGATISSISTYTHLNGISPVATKGGGGRSIFYTCKNIILYKSTAIENHGTYEKYKGKVCNYDSKLSECHGYTVVDNPHIEIKCTNTEKDEIKKLLEEGVILP